MTGRFASVLVFVSLCAGCSGSNAITNTAPTTTAGTGTDTFASFLVPGGSSAHTFKVTKDGTIGITLTAVTPAEVVGLGLGVPNASGSGCSLTNSMDVDVTTGTATPQLTIPASVGTYCVEVYDSGQLGGFKVSFSVTIAHP